MARFILKILVLAAVLGGMLHLGEGRAQLSEADLTEPPADTLGGEFWMSFWEPGDSADEWGTELPSRSYLLDRFTWIFFRLSDWSLHSFDMPWDLFEMDHLANVLVALERELETDAEETIRLNYGPLPALPTDDWEDPAADAPELQGILPDFDRP